MIKSEIFASVLRDVCEVTEISERDIMSKAKSEEIVDARHLLVVTLRRSGYYPGMIAERLHISGRAVRKMIGSFRSRVDNSPGFPRLDTNPMSGKTGSYVIPEGLSVTYAGNLVLATEKAALAGEVEAMKSGAEQALASVDRQREILDKATALLSDLNPAFREKRENDKRFDDLESSVNELKDLVRQLASKS